MVSSKLLKKTAESDLKPSSSRDPGRVVSKELIAQTQQSKDAPPLESRSKKHHDQQPLTGKKRSREEKDKGALKIADPEQTVPKQKVIMLHQGPFNLGPQIELPDVVTRSLDNVSREDVLNYGPKYPSIDDMKRPRAPADYCSKEREWFGTLPMDLLCLETARYMEMARLGLNGCWQYGALLEEKCRRIEKGTLTPNDEIVKERDTLKEENQSLHQKMTEMEAQLKDVQTKHAAEVKKIKGEHTAGLKELKAGYKSALTDAQNKIAKEKKDKDELSTRLKEKEDFVAHFPKSKLFKTEVARCIWPHWCRGMRVGVRQAIQKYESEDHVMEYFEPQYTEDCGEPEIEDSDEEAEVETETSPGANKDASANQNITL